MTSWWLGADLDGPGRLVWTSPPWLVLVAAAAALLAWVLALVGPRTLSRVVLESALWGAALLGVVVAVAGPTWIEEEGRTERGRVVVLVDGSRSMGVHEDGVPRHQAIAGMLDRVAREVGDYDLYHFGDDLAVGLPEAFDLPGTDLEGALEAVSERVAGEKLAALVVMTDGLDRGLLRRRFRAEERPTPPTLPGPLTVFQVGTESELEDLAVRSVDAGGYAFIRNPFKITAEIEGLGYDGRTIPVSLERDGAPVTQTPVTLDAEGKATAVFEVVPEDAGRFSYSVSVPVFEGDAVPDNNSMPLVVSVVRDRIRVLQVAGAPSWDVKFLRRFLEGDPSVQLVSFFILRTQRDLTTPYGDRELSLIAFPYRRLFDEDLWSFDVVIFQNFDYEPYFTYDSNPLLENMARYVEEDGGALVMIGGDRSFGEGKYGGSPLEEVLPVHIPIEGEPDASPFVPLLTDEGRRHPLTRLAPSPVENEVWWSRMHPMDGTNVVERARDDAAVLLAHPSRLGEDGEPLPILAVREAGRGRTMALTLDSSWRWSLSEAAQGRGNQAYLRFWKNAIRWLMKDSTVARVTVDTPRENYAVGDEARIVVRARDPGFAPLPGASVSATVTRGNAVITLSGTTDADGEVALTLPADGRGSHRVAVTVEHQGERVGTAETVFAVTTRDPELDEVAPDQAFLRWLAEATGGRLHARGEAGPILTDPGAGRVVWERRESPLWRAPALGAWILSFAGASWIARRRSGLR